MKAKSESIMLSDWLDLEAAHQMLEKSGVDWTFGWFRTQVFLGKIPSRKIFSAKVVSKETIRRIIMEKRLK